MATDKDKLLRGFRFLAVAFPFIFMGPALLTWQGIPQYRDGHYLWLIISIAFMVVAAILGVKGLRTIISAFFD